MKKFLIAGSSLAAVATAGSAGAVDVTLGGSIDMGVDFGLGKNNGNLVFGAAYNEVSLSINAAHTTDGGLAFGGGFTMGTSNELEFAPYDTNGTAEGGKMLVKATVTGQTNIVNQLWAVSGGGAIDSGNVVSVKINSSWRGVEGTQTLHQIPVSTFTSANLCKIAGRGTFTTTLNSGGADAAWALILPNEAGTRADAYVGDNSSSPLAANIGAIDGYLPAGQMAYVANSSDQESFSGTWNVAYDDGMGNNIRIQLKTTVSYDSETLGTTISDYIMHDRFNVDLDEADDFEVTNAQMFVGPFMEVMMASSETKMVIGAACLSGVSESDTVFYLDNASKVMTVSDASVYIEGGFGRLTLQAGDYAGGVGAVAGAGDQADIDANGPVVIAQGLGILGANPYLAVDLAAADALGDLEVITGGTIDLGGLSAAIDVALDNPDDVFGISSWDLGLAYDVGDLSLAAATDSSSDWGLSASMAIAGFAVNTTFGSSSAGDHEKAGITYSVSISTALNGFGLAIGFDEALEPAIGLDYDLGGLNLYAGYDASDEGGSIGATLSF